MKARLAVFPLLLSLAALAGCSGSSIVSQGPSDALRAYAAALQDGRVDEAYRLLSDEAKRNMSLEAFRRAVKESPQDATEIAQALSRPSSDPVVNATVVLPSGDELLLVYESGRWRIDASAVELYGQATPRQAITGFLRAFERKRYDVILRYVPDAEREGVTMPGEVAPPPPAPKEVKAAGEASGGLKAEVLVKPAEGAPALKASGGELTAEQIKVAWEGPQKEQINRVVQAIKTALPSAQIEETGDSAAMSYGNGGTVAFVREHGLWKIRDL